jgi:hypothetical protein
MNLSGYKLKMSFFYRNCFAGALLFFLLLVLAALIMSCQITPQNTRSDTSTNSISSNKSVFPFDLSAPDRIFYLPDDLYEISGISVIDSFHIACIQDENGIIFIYDTVALKITDKFTFAGNGDYEDIVIVDKIFYMLESSGRLFRVEKAGQIDQKTVTFQTPLSHKNDCEGLCYDSLTKSLLIACKGQPFLDKDKKGKHKRAVYRFNLAQMELIKDPFLIIHVNEIENFNNLDTYGRLSYDLASALDPDGNIVFQPSGIAIQPVTGYLLVLAHVGRTLLILDRDEQILTMQTLPLNIFSQPEGICFTPAGDMFISNEGAGGKATILLFKNKIPR